MRTAKKTLCLVLAVAMMLSLCVFSASADVEFTDAADIQFPEAAEVLATIGVIEGFPEGDFRPTENLTRAQGAAITARLMAWQEVPAITTFSDVPEWAHPYVAFCESNGIVAGYGDGTFGPDDELTGAQFAKMLLGALGYDPEAEKMQNVGTEWIVRVAQFARQNDLDADIDNFPWNEVVTREQAAQMALNAIQAKMVEYTTTGSAIAGTNNASYMTSTIAKEQKISDETLSNSNSIYIVELGEYYFKDLEVADDTDAFERDGSEWKFKGKKIGFYPDTADLTYTTETKISTIYTDLGLTDKVTNVDYFINGLPASDIKWAEKSIYAITRGGTEKYGGNGVDLEIFYDDSDEYIKIIEIHNYAAKINTVKAETAAADAYVTLSKDTTPGFDKATLKYDTDAFAKDEWVVFTYSEKESEVESMVKAEEVKGTLDSFRAAEPRDNGGFVQLDGTSYDKNYDSEIEDEEGLLGKEATVYLDQNGYLVKASLEADDEYAAIVGLARANQVNVDNAKARLFFDDASSKSVEITNSRKLGNDVYYIEDDTVTLKALALDPAAYEGYIVGENPDNHISLFDIVGYTGSGTEYEFDEDLVFADAVKVPYMTKAITQYGQTIVNLSDKTYVANGDTTFMVLSVDEKGGSSYKVYDGIGNVPTIKFRSNATEQCTYVSVMVDEDDDTLASVVFIFVPEEYVDVSDKAVDDVILVKGGGADKIRQSGSSYYEYDAIVDGEEVTIKSDDQVKGWALISGYSVDSDGIIKDIKNMAGPKADDIKADHQSDDIYKLNYAEYYSDYSNQTLFCSNGTYVVKSDATVYVWDSDEVLTVGDTDLLDSIDDAELWFVRDSDGVITDLYVKESGNSEVATGTVDGYSAYIINNDATLYIVVSGPKDLEYNWVLKGFPVGGDKDNATTVSSSIGYDVGEVNDGGTTCLNTSSKSLNYFAEITIVGGPKLVTETVAGQES